MRHFTGRNGAYLLTVLFLYLLIRTQLIFTHTWSTALAAVIITICVQNLWKTRNFTIWPGWPDNSTDVTYRCEHCDETLTNTRLLATIRFALNHHRFNHTTSQPGSN